MDSTDFSAFVSVFEMARRSAHLSSAENYYDDSFDDYEDDYEEDFDDFDE